jgi:hypothetical protein
MLRIRVAQSQDLFPAHLLEVLAMKLQEDPFAQSGIADKLLIHVAGNAERIRNVKAAAGEPPQCIGLSADTVTVIRMHLFQGDNPVHDSMCHSVTI